MSFGMVNCDSNNRLVLGAFSRPSQNYAAVVRYFT